MNELTHICAELDAKRARNKVYGVEIHPITLSKISENFLKADPDYTPGDLIQSIDGVKVYASLKVRKDAFKIMVTHNTAPERSSAVA